MPPGDGPIFMDNVACVGNETQLTNCRHLTNHNCVHQEDVGVSCMRQTCPRNANPRDGDLCLFDGTSSTNGRLEMYKNGAWGTICDDDFSSVDAAVACRQLGFSGQGTSAESRWRDVEK